MQNRSITQRFFPQIATLCFLTSSFLIIKPHILQAGTYHVPADFESIQTAIDSVSTEGDTVVVAPGSYVENIDYHGKNIFLTSHYYLEGDEDCIRETIIDGGQNGSVVTFREGEDRSAVLNGFTITNGSGRMSGLGYTKGGGIFIDESYPSLTNCMITRNHCCGVNGGGGIFAGDSPAYMSNLVITENSAQNIGGGLWTGNSEVEMDSLNRCSVFLNEAGAYCDIFQFYEGDSPPRFYLDTATVAVYDGYFFGGNVDPEVDILSGKLLPVQYDLWVSPSGDNNNSGATPDEPLRTITYAFHIINADSANPQTVHLLPGIYAPSGGQSFPINLRSYVSLIGSGRDTTILDLEFSNPSVMTGFNEERDYCIRSMSIINASRVEFMKGLSFTQNEDAIIEDVLFASNETSHLISHSYPEWIVFKENTCIIIRDCDFLDNRCIRVAGVGIHADALVQNCRFENTTPLEGVDPELYGMASALGMVAPPSFYPYQFSHRVENSVFVNNLNDYTDYYHFAPGLNARDYRYPLDIVNCTFADNSSLVSGSMWVEGYATENEIRLANCLFWDNDLYEISLDASTQPIDLLLSHNIIQDMEGGIHEIGDAEVILEEGNFSADPLFVGEGEHPYRLAPNSPAIDAGTAFWVVDGDTVVNLSPDQYEGAAPDIGAYEWESETVVHADPPQLPEDFAITSIHPNPFNSTTSIHYSLPRADHIELTLYTITGRLVTTLIDAWVGAGEHSIRFAADELASGVYVVTLQSPLGSDSRKLTLVN